MKKHHTPIAVYISFRPFRKQTEITHLLFTRIYALILVLMAYRWVKAPIYTTKRPDMIVRRR